jgi:hypothetical protein
MPIASVIGPAIAGWSAIEQSRERADQVRTDSVFGGLRLHRLRPVDIRATRPIEHVGARRAQLLFVGHKALGYAIGIRDRVLAKPHGIRRTCIGIRLRIGDCGERSHDRGQQNDGVQFGHNIHSNWVRRDNRQDDKEFPAPWGAKAF